MAGEKQIQASFIQFIGGFAVQTLVQLGRMSNPMSGETSVDLPNAKYSIDILGILQEKTAGNLSGEEAEYLSNVLRDLRMEYVAVTGKAAQDAGNETDKKEEA